MMKQYLEPLQRIYSRLWRRISRHTVRRQSVPAKEVQAEGGLILNLSERQKTASWNDFWKQVNEHRRLSEEAWRRDEKNQPWLSRPPRKPLTENKETNHVKKNRRNQSSYFTGRCGPEAAGGGARAVR
jgi:hypothetical protein